MDRPEEFDCAMLFLAIEDASFVVPIWSTAVARMCDDNRVRVPRTGPSTVWSPRRVPMIAPERYP